MDGHGAFVWCPAPDLLLCLSSRIATCLRIGLAAGAYYLHLFAINERVGRILDHLVADAEAGDDLHIGAVVLSG